MGPTVALSVSVLCGAVLLLMAFGLLVARPRASSLWFWSVSWALLGLGCLALPGTIPVLRAFFVLGSLTALAQGVLRWAPGPTSNRVGRMPPALLWVGSGLALVPPALGLPEAAPATLLAALWALIPTVVAVLAVSGQGGKSGPARGQASRLLLSLGCGTVPFALSWGILPWFPDLGWTLGFPPFALVGAVLQFRALVRYDTKVSPGQSTSFVVQKTRDLVMFLQADGKVQAVNPAVRGLLSVEEDALVGKALGSLAADDPARRLLGPLEALAFPTWEGTLNLRTGTGDPVPVHLVYRRIHNPGREAVGAVLLLYDPRTSGAEDQEDKLTALASRRWVRQLLEAEFHRAWRYGTPLTILWIAVDHDPGGDEVLRRGGGVLRAGLRKTDSCGRSGEREFLAVLPGILPDRAEVVRSRLVGLFALANEGETSGARLRIGIAGLDGTIETTDDFVALAREAAAGSGGPG